MIRISTVWVRVFRLSYSTQADRHSNRSRLLRLSDHLDMGGAEAGLDGALRKPRPRHGLAQALARPGSPGQRFVVEGSDDLVESAVAVLECANEQCEFAARRTAGVLVLVADAHQVCLHSGIGDEQPLGHRVLGVADQPGSQDFLFAITERRGGRGNAVRETSASDAVIWSGLLENRVTGEVGRGHCA